MNTEYLLDAIGQLDDSLVQEAEQYRRPKPRPAYGPWLGWVASFAVVIMLGWWVTHFGLGGGGNTSSGGSTGAPAASSPAGGDSVNDSQNATRPDAEGNESPTNPDASPDLRGEVLNISLRMDEPMNRLSYTFLHWYGKDQILDTLPEGCTSLGTLESLTENEEPNVPYTDSAEYVGCQVWLLREDTVWKTFKLYVERPEGGYLECRSA